VRHLATRDGWELSVVLFPNAKCTGKVYVCPKGGYKDHDMMGYQTPYAKSFPAALQLLKELKRKPAP
jgi:hypothetical protein